MNIKYLISILLSCLIVSVNIQAQDRVKDVGSDIISAVNEYNDGNYSAASSILEKIINIDSTNDAAWYYLALCSLAGKEADKAEICLRRAVEIDPQNFWYRYRLAGLYALTERPELTVDMYEKLLEDFPKKSELYFDLAEMYSAQGEYEKSLVTLKEIETVFGMTESVAVYRFSLLMRMKRQEEAYKSLEEYNSRYSSPYVLVTLAEHQLSMYNDSTALAYYDEALDIVPDYSPALLGKAETLRMTRKYDEYFVVLNEFVSNPSDVVKSKTDYLSAVVQRSDPKFIRTFRPQMDSIIAKMTQLHPSDSSALNLAGLYYYSTDRKKEAKSMFKANVEVNASSVSAYATYVEFLMFAKEWEELSLEGRKAYARFPQEPAFLEMASIGDYNLNEFDKVLDICDKILEVAPTDSASTLRAWSTKGDIYHQKGDSNRSYKAYEQALSINPDYIYVLNNYAYYLSVEGKKLKKAYSMSKKTIEAEPDNSTYLDTFGWILYLLKKPEEAKPYFKHAMLYGGKESAVILDHYAEVLFALEEYDLALAYWSQAQRKNKGDIPDLDDRISLRKQQMKKKK